MSNDTTRILDLPENSSFSSGSHAHSFSQPQAPSYAPIDVHPNPYGHPPPSVPSFPKSDIYEQQRLPSRDIPVDPTIYTQDEKVQANYIEPVNKTREYLKSYDEAVSTKVLEHEKLQKRQKRWDMLVEEGQLPLLISVLFFIFRMPIIEMYLKKLPFVTIESDGHFTLTALLVISGLFGLTFYNISNVVEYLSEL